MLSACRRENFSRCVWHNRFGFNKSLTLCLFPISIVFVGSISKEFHLISHNVLCTLVRWSSALASYYTQMTNMMWIILLLFNFIVGATHLVKTQYVCDRNRARLHFSLNISHKFAILCINRGIRRVCAIAIILIIEIVWSQRHNFRTERTHTHTYSYAICFCRFVLAFDRDHLFPLGFVSYIVVYGFELYSGVNMRTNNSSHNSFFFSWLYGIVEMKIKKYGETIWV